MPRRCSAGTAELGSRQIRALCEISVRENWEHAQEPGRKAEEAKTLGASAVRVIREEEMLRTSTINHKYKSNLIQFLENRTEFRLGTARIWGS